MNELRNEPALEPVPGVTTTTFQGRKTKARSQRKVTQSKKFSSTVGEGGMLRTLGRDSKVRP